MLLPIDGGLVPVPLAITLALVLVPALFRMPPIDRPVLWPLFAFYGLHLLGLAWTSDLDFGLFDLQIKLGLLLLPLAATVVATHDPSALRKSMLAFSAGILLSFLLSLFQAWECYAQTGDRGCFSQSAFSYGVHPSYAAWYAGWAATYWTVELVGGRIAGMRWRTVAVLVVLPCVVYIVMLASKSGVIGLGAMVLVLLVVVFLKRAASGWKERLILIGAVAALVAIAGSASVVTARMAAAYAAVERAFAGDATIYTSEAGSEMRLVAWECSVDLLVAHPMGVGTGDIKEELVACYEAKGAGPAAERRLNSHGQFLQGGATLGWPGLVITLLIAIVPLVIGRRRRNLHLCLFALLFLINAAVESVLEVQAGVLFVGIFLGLLSNQRSSRTA